MKHALPRTLAVLIAAAPLIADAGPRTSTAARTQRGSATKAPTAKRSARSKAKVPRTKSRRRVVRPAKNPAASGELAALLHAYVHGGSNKFERRVARGMPKGRGSKAAARRLLSRIEAVDSSTRRRRLGTREPDAPSTQGLLNATAKLSNTHSNLLYLMPAIPLPPQGVPKPNTFQLNQVGLVTTSTEDADGTDELTSFAVIATPKLQDYELTTVDLSSAQPTSVGAQASQRPLLSTTAHDVVLVTALVEGDDGDVAAAKAEIEVLVSLAASVAKTMDESDRIGVLETMIDYTLALDDLSETPGGTTRSVVSTVLYGDQWAGLWATDRATVAGIEYAVAVPHQMGSGRYDLLLDVPARPPEMKTVRLSASGFSGDLVSSQYEKVRDVSVTVSIGDEGHTFTGNPIDFMPVERKVIDGDIALKVSGTVQYDFLIPEGIVECETVIISGVSIKQCKGDAGPFIEQHGLKKSRVLDLSARGTEYSTVYSTQLGGFKPAADPKAKGTPKNTKTTQPTASPPIRLRSTKGNTKPWASLKLNATND